MRSRSNLLACTAACLLAWSCSDAMARGGGGGGPGLFRAGGAFPGGHMGGGGRHGGGRGRAAIYNVIQATAVTDKAGFDKAIGALGPSLANVGGRVLADVDASDTLGVGTGSPAGATHLSIVVFDGTSDAQAWQMSPAFKDLLGALRKVSTVSLYEAGGIPDPGRPLPALAGRGAAGDALLGIKERKLPEIPKIGDICKGC